MRVSFIEIYNEEIRDLLKKDGKDKLELKETPDKTVFIKDVVMLNIKNVSEMENAMFSGNSNRSVGETAMNAESSRSHCIFTVYIEVLEKVEGEPEPRITAGKLNLVDLAGSER